MRIHQTHSLALPIPGQGLQLVAPFPIPCLPVLEQGWFLWPCRYKYCLTTHFRSWCHQVALGNRQHRRGRPGAGTCCCELRVGRGRWHRGSPDTKTQTSATARRHGKGEKSGG